MTEIIVCHRGEAILRECLSDVLTIGSSADNDLCLADSVLAHHAKIAPAGGGMVLVELEGVVLVNGRRVIGSQGLKSGDAFDIGAYRFQVVKPAGAGRRAERTRTASILGGRGARVTAAPPIRFLTPIQRRMRHIKLVMGRAPGCDLVISDPFVSLRHAEIFVRDGAHYIRDLHSRNGTYVNDHRISERPLPGRGTIRLGRYTLTYEIETPTPSAFEGIRVPPVRQGLPNRMIIGGSAALLSLMEKLKRIAATDDSVLLTGETGVGKDLLAHYLHDESAKRGTHPFVVVNCAAIPETMAESQIFGHVKGSFTGAVGNHEGFFKQADRGTLFLDELAELTVDSQARLLRAMECGLIRPVGSVREVPVDVRLVAATNRDMAVTRLAGKFRDDLYERFDWVIRVPPLRERREDIPLLVDYFLKAHSPSPARLAPGVVAFLEARDWQGNVRAINRAVRRAIANSMARHSDTIDMCDFDLGEGPLPSEFKPSIIRKAKRAELVERLKFHKGNISEVSREIGISRLTIRRWLKVDGIEAKAFRG